MATIVTTKVTQGGRIVIPAEIRKQLGIEVGEEVDLELKGENLSILTRKQAFKRAQALVREYVPEGVSLVDELITERRKEAENE